MADFPVKHWGSYGPLSLLLWPVSLLFRWVARLRRLAFARGWLLRERLPVPVVVIGNIHVGGVGKTPLTQHLARCLVAAGFHPGIISRGYGRQTQEALLVAPESVPVAVGDEPLLLRQTAGCPVAVARQRAEAGRLLLAQHPEVDVLLCDDGLQHYALERDIEICVLDGLRGWGNGWCLPAGPLREGRERLAQVDAVVVHGNEFPLATPAGLPRFAMRLVTGPAYRLQQPEQMRPASRLPGRLLAVTGIGHPQRFFNGLLDMGLEFTARAFPDHHVFCAGDLAGDFDCILMTEKDAVKCRAFDDGRIWVLPVEADLQPDLAGWLIAHLRGLHGRQTA